MQMSKHMEFQVVISATEKNEAEKGSGCKARGNGVAVLKRVVRKLGDS